MSINKVLKAISFERFTNLALTANSKLTFLAALTLVALPLAAQPLPTLTGQTCGPVGTASVTAAGTFNVLTKIKAISYQVSVDVHCDANGHPQGTLKLSGLNLNGSDEGVVTATGFARLTSFAGAAPTAHLSGSCSLAGPKTAASNDCHYWIMFSQFDRRTPQPTQVGIVGFSITQKNGTPVVSGAGRIAESGKISVSTKVPFRVASCALLPRTPHSFEGASPQKSPQRAKK